MTRRWDIALLIVFAAVTFFLRLDYLPIRGEESRRGQAARELVETGDWVVLHQQRQQYVNKPPMFYWILVASAESQGGYNPWTIRLPSAIAHTLTMLLLYLYGSTLLSRFTGITMALVFSTMMAILEQGMYAEIESVFTMFIASSLLLWHLGYLKDWGPYKTWIPCYILVAMGMLVKGLQAPIYFGGGVGLYLLVRRDWKFLFHPAHFLGLFVFVALLSIWWIPFVSRMGVKVGISAFTGEAVARIFTLKGFLGHLWYFPVRQFSDMAPWSTFLLLFTLPSFWKNWGEKRQVVIFSALCILVAYPSVWLPPGGAVRYIRTMYPILAVLVTMVLCRLVERQAERGIQIHWRIAMSFWGIFAIVSSGLAIAMAAGAFEKSRLHLPYPMAILFSLIAISISIGLFWASRITTVRSRVAIGLLVGFMALGNLFFILPARKSRLVDPKEAILRFHDQIPKDKQLVSLGRLGHKFTFWYPEPIPVIKWPENESALNDGDWFCFQHLGSKLPKLPFRWEKVAVISMDRNRKPGGRIIKAIHIGRKLFTPTEVSMRKDATAN